jgi:hypothetical protein
MIYDGIPLGTGSLRSESYYMAIFHFSFWTWANAALDWAVGEQVSPRRTSYSGQGSESGSDGRLDRILNEILTSKPQP